ncbi:MAG: polymer-forming cytoskeletal protein [Anaerolineaceae bacterium]|nr:polymer-forming cytoskeletal protein [Anaerolineaceae bacterium]
MKTMKKFLLSVGLLFALLVATNTPVLAQSEGDDQIVFGGEYTLNSGDTLDGNLVILGGNATIEEDARVKGNIVITGGELYVSGTVDDGIIAIGGAVFLEDGALVKGDIGLASASFEQSADAVVRGDVRYDIAELDNFDLDFSPPFIAPVQVPQIQPSIWSGVGFIGNILWGFMRTLAIAALAALVVLMLQKPTERVAASIVGQPAISGGLGLLTIIVAPAFVVLLMITIILIPVGILGILVLALAALFGWIAIGLEIGNRIATLAKQTWAPAISAGIGTLVLTLVANIFGSIDCIGWIIPTLVIMVGLGGVILSKFGTQIYQPSKPMTSASTKEPVVLEGVVVDAPSKTEDIIDVDEGSLEESE